VSWLLFNLFIYVVRCILDVTLKLAVLNRLGFLENIKLAKGGFNFFASKIKDLDPSFL
jgi:hypothetical protein